MQAFLRRYAISCVLLVLLPLVSAAQSVESTLPAKLRGIAKANIRANQSNFPDHSDFFRAAPGYPDVYLSDLGLTMTGLPDEFSAAQVGNIIDKFLARTNAAGWVPMALKKDGSLFVFCSAWDLRCAHPTGDGAFFLPLLEELYWHKTGSTTQFLKDATKIRAALDGIPRDPTTRACPKVAGLYPCGEGAGYAGGIISAAVDGLRTARALAGTYARPAG